MLFVDTHSYNNAKSIEKSALGLLISLQQIFFQWPFLDDFWPILVNFGTLGGGLKRSNIQQNKLPP